MKYPIGIQAFDKIIEGGYLYFDKTALIYDIVHNGNIYFLSRPRRFGKSLLVSTLECYFQGIKSLFKGLAIDKLETEWNKYAVFSLSFGKQNFAESNALPSALEAFIGPLEDKYGKAPHATTFGDRFAGVIHRAHVQTGRRVVVLVDEYDKPLLDVMGTPLSLTVDNERLSLEEYNRNMLKGFYAVLKDADADLQFVLLTGVTKFSQITVFSGFNQPNDISLSDKYDAICGITKDEMFARLDAQICEMAAKYNVAVDVMKQMLTSQYDGYHFSSRLTDIFNPFSILNAFANMRLDDYWFRTGSPTYLVRLLANSGEQLNQYTNRFLPTAMFVDYRADKAMPLPMIYQSGYLTIKDYDLMTNSYKLDFPNDEVKRGFVTLVAANYLNPDDNAFAWIIQVATALRNGNLDVLASLFSSFFAGIPYSLRDKSTEREKEKHFQYTFYLVMRMISAYTVFAEKQQSQGRLDCVVETSSHVYIFEFKRDGSARDALNQINEKGYAREYAADKRAIHKIGVNFSSSTGTIDGWLAE